MAAEMPVCVKPEDAPKFEAILRALAACVEATKAEGESKTRNREELVAYRQLARALGYHKRDEIDDVGQWLYDRVS